MRAVLQRVTSARVRVGDQVVGTIGRGLLAFVGVASDDEPPDVAYITGKIRDVRIFEDDAGKMNRSVEDVAGEVLVVSQFTLYGDCRKGRRPSFDAAAGIELGRALYDDVIRALQTAGLRVHSGTFQAHMHVELVNDGPVTILIDSKKQF